MGRIGTIIVHELREALPATLFFFVVFHMLAFTRTVILDDYHLSAASASIATVGALIVAKAILIVDSLPLARWFGSRLIYNVLWRTWLFGMVSLLFRILEELLPAMFGSRSFADEAAHLWSAISWPHFWVMQMWLFALLLLFTLAAALVHRIGATSIQEILGAPVGEH